MRRIILLSACVLGVGIALGAQTPTSAPDVQVQLGDLFFADGRYIEARDAYRRAVGSADAALSIRAGGGLVLSLLRTGDFQGALETATTLGHSHPSNALVAATRGDALWSMGRFEDAEAAYDAALTIDPAQPRARHGRARSLAAQNRLQDALT